MSLLSIFSFDTLRFSERKPKGQGRAALLALGLFVLAELASRGITQNVGRAWEYWHPDAAVKFEGYHQLVNRTRRPIIAMVGDSTAASNLDSRLIQELTFPTAEVWNIGWSGNFAIAFEQSTIPVLFSDAGQPAIVVVSLIPTGFIDRGDTLRPGEAGILASAACRRAKGDWMIEDHIHLARVWNSLPVMLNLLLGKDSENAINKRRNRGFFNKNTRAATVPETKTERSGKKTIIPQLSDRRLAVLQSLAMLCARSSTKLLFVVPPTLDTTRQRVIVKAKYLEALRRISADQEGLVFAIQEHFQLTPNDFVDTNHLNKQGATKLSQALYAELVGLGWIDDLADREP